MITSRFATDLGSRRGAKKLPAPAWVSTPAGVIQHELPSNFMKTRFPICLTVLALAATTYSQGDGDQALITKTPPAVAAITPRLAHLEPDGTLHFFAGSLPEV